MMEIKFSSVRTIKFKTKYRDVAQLVARLVWDQDVAGSNPVIPTKKQGRGVSSPLFFSIDVLIRSCFAKQKQVRIPRSEIDKLACQAQSVGIKERSEVTLSLRPKQKRRHPIRYRLLFLLFALYFYLFKRISQNSECFFVLWKKTLQKENCN